MRVHNNQSNEYNKVRKLSFQRPNNNNVNIKGGKFIQFQRSKSGKGLIFNDGNNNNENKNLNFDYGNNCEKLLNKLNANNDFKFFHKQPQNKVNQNTKIIKESQNTLKKFNTPNCLGAKNECNNHILKFENKSKVKDKPMKIIAQNKIVNNNYNNKFQILDIKERPNSSDKQKDEINKKIKNENFNPNRNNYFDKKNFYDIINEDQEQKTINNKNIDLYKRMNNLMGKEKNLDYHKNFNEKMELNEQFNEMKKQNNKNYEDIIKEKENEINCLKQHINEIQKRNEEYKTLVMSRDSEINKLKQIINKFKENYEGFESAIKNRDNEMNNLKQTINKLKESNQNYGIEIERKNNEMNNLKQTINNKLKESIQKYVFENDQKEKEKNNLKQEINKLKENNQKYGSEIKEKDNEIIYLKQTINELNIKIKQYIIYNNKEQELKNKENEIKEREEEFNKKINFLEDKENYLENEIKEKQKMIFKFQNDIEENKKIKIENNSLILKNQQLQKENQEFESIKKKLQKENAMLNQKNLELSSFIKKLENKSQFHKKSNSADYKKINRVVPKPLETYNNPTLVGLNNIGATCFMNSTLQCLSQTKALANYFLYEKNKEAIRNNNIALKNKNGYQLSPVFQNLIQKLWEKNGPNSFSPNTFMNTINNMNPLFKTGQAGDAKDFIIFILEQLHKELKKSVQNNFNNSNNATQLNQYDKNNAFNHFFNDFKKECSVISDIFFGFNETTNECLNCRNIYYSKGLNNPICYNYGIFNCLIFPLEEVKNMKNNQMQNYNIQICNNRVSLYDCFFYNQKSELFSGDNRNYCNVCKQLYDSIYTSKIFISPTVLVIILNRGRGNIYDVKLDFSETIDITQFVQQKDSPQMIYNLYGVITHIGQSGPNAHFVASCKSPIDNKWYRYNDAFVNPINNLQKEVIDFGTPYILFYLKNN